MQTQDSFMKRVLRDIVFLLIIIPILFLFDSYYTLPTFFPKERNKPFLIEKFFSPKDSAVLTFTNANKKEGIVIHDRTLSLLQIDSEKKRFQTIFLIPFNADKISFDEKKLVVYYVDNTRLYMLDIKEPKHPVKKILLQFTNSLDVSSLSLSKDRKTLYIVANKKLFIVNIANRTQTVRQWNYPFIHEVAPGIIYAFDKGNIDIFKFDADFKSELINSYVAKIDNPQIVFSRSGNRAYLFDRDTIEVLNIQRYLSPQPFGLIHVNERIIKILPQSNDTKLFVATQKNILVYEFVTPAKPTLMMQIKYQTN